MVQSFENSKNSGKPIGSAYETLAGYEHLALIQSEVNSAKEQVKLFCTQGDFEKQLKGGTGERQTRFVTDAVEQGLAV